MKREEKGAIADKYIITDGPFGISRSESIVKDLAGIVTLPVEKEGAGQEKKRIAVPVNLLEKQVAGGNFASKQSLLDEQLSALSLLKGMRLLQTVCEQGGETFR